MSALERSYRDLAAKHGFRKVAVVHWAGPPFGDDNAFEVSLSWVDDSATHGCRSASVTAPTIAEALSRALAEAIAKRNPVDITMADEPLIAEVEAA